MSKFLAAILGLCALTTPSVAAGVFRAPTLQLSQESQPPVAAPSTSPQDSPQNSAPASPPVESAQPGTATPSEPSPMPATAPTQEPAQAQPGADTKKPASPPKTPSKKRHHRKIAAANPTAPPAKKVVRNGGTADPANQLAPGVSAEQASSQRRTTTQLLAATDANLKQISSRTLNSSQQASISQIRKYMEQARAAEQAGDVQRAQNLASKGLLLSDDLAKQ
jgi:outer membrane biosynthesis protein TonB